MTNKVNEDLYKCILDAAVDLIFLKDSTFHYIMVNKANADFFGKTQEEIIGKTDYDLMPKPNADQCRTSDQETIQQNKMNVNIEKVGDDSWETYKFPVVLPDGNIGIGGVIRNITQLKKAEEEIKALNTELENRVDQRTRELKRINEELEAFAYSVSHDLRAPLRAVDGFSGLLEERCGKILDAESSRFLGVVRENTKRMDQLIKDLLFFSKAGRNELRKSNLDMASISKKVFDDLTKSEESPKPVLSLHTLPLAFADEGLIKQVWKNLLENAIKYSRSKPNPIIEIGSYPKENFQVYFIRDNGVGFNQDYSHKLFTVFQRLHNPDEFEGSGIGLAIVKRIIQRHNGEIWAEGKEDEGATFFFSLPKE